jgi:hypothetical protein
VSYCTTDRVTNADVGNDEGTLCVRLRPATPLSPNPIGSRDRKLCVPASRQVCPYLITKNTHNWYLELESDPAFSIRLQGPLR